jgi:hypothetical protein
MLCASAYRRVLLQTLLSSGASDACLDWTRAIILSQTDAIQTSRYSLIAAACRRASEPLVGDPGFPVVPTFEADRDAIRIAIANREFRALLSGPGSVLLMASCGT